ncbi:hypothetical protein [Curtobacterium aurantiacum]|uniref:hypothetical protein n=1 Tax=Curtobacterium aurantiacum TaxID=3236919 RepID=UPI001BDFAE98|nr:hypothetical protein [Curtobacterium flaccumfaciens]MBT1674623.1 hypothetical protein [Curtobacterium flaccumfaciens pv. flaccumfaciens]
MNKLGTRGATTLAAMSSVVLGCALLSATPAAAAPLGEDQTIRAVEAAERALGLADDFLPDSPEVLASGAPSAAPGTSAATSITPGPNSDHEAGVQYTADRLDENSTRYAAVMSAPASSRASWAFDDDVELVLLDDGRVTVSDANGDLIAGIDAPWAVDASGRALPTNYRVDGTTLVQDVQVDSRTAYPVVADPRYSTFPGYWTVTFNRAESATVVGTVASCAALFSKSPVPVLRALTVTCGVLAAFSTAQLAGGKCVKLHLAGLPGVIAQWWPTFPKC